MIPADPVRAARDAAAERRIGRLLTVVTYVAVAVLVLGVLAMAAAGISPLDAPPVLDLAGVLAALAALRPEGLLWLGLVVVLATPITRVVVAAVAYARNGEQRMVAVSIAILVVIAIGVISAVATEA